MKKYFIPLFAACIIFCGCQKPSEKKDVGRPARTDSSSIPNVGITYEVITTDTSGWSGMWNGENGRLTGTSLDSITYGSPIYLHSGWTYTIADPSVNFVPLISVFTKTFSGDITINLYKDGKLIKSISNYPMLGMARLLLMPDSMQTNGTAANPVLTYEVTISDQDTSKFASDAWVGHWYNADGIYNDSTNPSLKDFPISAGWKYSFKPDHLPFTMSMQATPYTKNGSTVTINFYVNGALVKSASGRDWIYPPLTYVVQ
jgi:hypothetical protein